LLQSAIGKNAKSKISPALRGLCRKELSSECNLLCAAPNLATVQFVQCRSHRFRVRFFRLVAGLFALSFGSTVAYAKDRDGPGYFDEVWYEVGGLTSSGGYGSPSGASLQASGIHFRENNGQLSRMLMTFVAGAVAGMVEGQNKVHTGTTTETRGDYKITTDYYRYKTAEDRALEAKYIAGLKKSVHTDPFSLDLKVFPNRDKGPNVLHGAIFSLFFASGSAAEGHVYFGTGLVFGSLDARIGTQNYYWTMGGMPVRIAVAPVDWLQFDCEAMINFAGMIDREPAKDSIVRRPILLSAGLTVSPWWPALYGKASVFSSRGVAKEDNNTPIGLSFEAGARF
jgi:hypothetical protein